MITENTEVKIHDQINTLTRVWAIANNVAKAIDLFDTSIAYIFQYHL